MHDVHPDWNTGIIVIGICRWAATGLDEGPVKVSHDALKSRMQTYEPFALSLNTIPEYPEIFVGYGFTRNSQVSMLQLEIL